MIQRWKGISGIWTYGAVVPKLQCIITREKNGFTWRYKVAGESQFIPIGLVGHTTPRHLLKRIHADRVISDCI